jgi:Yip1 domain
MASFQDRVVGAMRLQAATFEDVEHDPTAISQSAILVLAVAVAGVVGSIGWGFYPGAAMASILFAFIGWAISSAVVWVIGTRLMPGKNTEADYQQVLRVVAFAQAPGLFTVLGIIPILGWVVRFVVWVWTLIALVIAVRQALDYDDTLKAVIVCVIAWVVMFMATLMVGFLGFGAAMMGSAMTS